MKYKDINFPPLFGLWRVTTEGDCEGRSTKNLGVFEGNLDDIAFSLASGAYYSLHFEEVKPEEIKRPTSKTVNVTLSWNTFNLDGPDRVKAFSKWLKDRDVQVSLGQYYGSVTLTSTKLSEYDIKKQNALEKLTEEEKKLLGLD